MNMKAKNHRKPLSRFFPAYHPKAGEPTYFVEKLWSSLADMGYVMDDIDFSKIDFDFQLYYNGRGKHHTVRGGDKVRVGDTVEFYTWIGKPYGKGSTNIVIAPPIGVKKTWDFEIKDGLFFLNGELFAYPESTELLNKLAENDGLAPGNVDLLDWFKWPKDSGPMQILCWNENINY